MGHAPVEHVRLCARSRFAASILVAVAVAIPIINACGSTSYHKMTLFGSNGPVRFKEVFISVLIYSRSI